jgi:hypothetical protein
MAQHGFELSCRTYLQGQALFFGRVARGPKVPLDGRKIKDGDLERDVVPLFVQFLVFIKSIKHKTDFELSREVPEVFLRRETKVWRLAPQFGVGVCFTRLCLYQFKL